MDPNSIANLSERATGRGRGKKILIQSVYSMLLQPQRLGEGRDDAAKIVFFWISARILDVIFDTDRRGEVRNVPRIFWIRHVC